ncbi:MAG: PL29 family lyase N-terminal domain-containing protein [Alistipes sp.]|nr:PL29 family lyase N-terminal domain-containing protein [Alistipes sp.]
MKRFLLSICSFMLLLSVGCKDTDNLWTDVNDLKLRISELENEIGEINSSISALYSLMKESTVIVGCQKSSEGYTLELSDGRTISVIVGKQIPALVPIIGIDSDGYWIYSVDNGENFQHLTDAKGEPIAANLSEEEGLSPMLRVDADGY